MHVMNNDVGGRLYGLCFMVLCNVMYPHEYVAMPMYKLFCVIASLYCFCVAIVNCLHKSLCNKEIVLLVHFSIFSNSNTLI